MNRYSLAVGVAGVLVLLVGCGSSSEPAASQTGGITIRGFVYSGALTVKAAQQVTVTNDDPTDHTLTDQTTLAGQTPTGQTPTGQTPTGQTPTGQTPTGQTPTGQKTGLFSTGTIAPNGGTRSFTAPLEPGSYPFGCRVHPTMTGTLTVQGGS